MAARRIAASVLEVPLCLFWSGSLQAHCLTTVTSYGVTAPYGRGLDRNPDCASEAISPAVAANGVFRLQGHSVVTDSRRIIGSKNSTIASQGAIAMLAELGERPEVSAGADGAARGCTSGRSLRSRSVNADSGPRARPSSKSAFRRDEQGERSCDTH